MDARAVRVRRVWISGVPDHSKHPDELRLLSCLIQAFHRAAVAYSTQQQSMKNATRIQAEKKNRINIWILFNTF